MSITSRLSMKMAYKWLIIVLLVVLAGCFHPADEFRESGVKTRGVLMNKWKDKRAGGDQVKKEYVFTIYFQTDSHAAGLMAAEEKRTFKQRLEDFASRSLHSLQGIHSADVTVNESQYKKYKLGQIMDLYYLPHDYELIMLADQVEAP